MNVFSYKPRQNGKWIALAIAIVAAAHVVLLIGADKVLTSIQANLIGRRVITVELFKPKPEKPVEDAKTDARLPGPTTKEKPSPEKPSSTKKPPSEQNNKDAANTDPAKSEPIEAKPQSSLGEPVNVASGDEVITSTERNAISPASAEENAKDASAKAESKDKVVDASLSTTELPGANASVPLPKVPPPKVSQNYVFEAFQGDAVEGKSVGKVLFELQASDNSYKSRFVIQFNWVTRLLADDREWVSQGRLSDEGLFPAKVVEQRGKRPAKTIEIDQEKRNGRIADQSFSIQYGVQDRTSIIWQFGLLARGNPEKYMRGTEFDFPLLVSSKSIVSKWRTKLETIQVGERNLDAIHFIRLDQRDDDLRFEFWLSPKHDMSPVKLTISDGKGRKFDVVRTNVS